MKLQVYLKRIQLHLQGMGDDEEMLVFLRDLLRENQLEAFENNLDQ